MGKKRVFITGGAGFLGSAVMAHLVANNYQIMGAMRSSTDLYRCKSFSNHVEWVDTGAADYKNKVIAFKPTVVIHAAWTGVTAKDRLEWPMQLQNFNLLGDILDIARQVKLEKLLVFGSQAEYGVIDTKVDEDHISTATDAYAITKIAMQNIIKTFCELNSIKWYWLRVFSVFGPGEAENWFIPWVITNQLNNKDLDLTLCEQRYDYLYIDDFATMITKVVGADAVSGIYNISSGKVTPLRAIVEQIEKGIKSKGKINYGAIPYRPNQSMEISGDNSKYNATFGDIKQTDIGIALAKTVSYYKDQYISSNNSGL
ncbi:NAD(P)-dependent oxidoreductase [Mucilaginibacter sp. HMF5004]|uniref:NAD-dependent epimerase/dehydratase family protein n=1 Tax=Mucilaginibacter rivuli TaxID=2857527 RepID=UPI001C5DB22B|nr:NAD(P)-dependent oxidoreductase [Mucilaginibacter rivuli]MBW4889893.1 NAD(P)-dependent oxidoreductase [Mucilaginibacter rivuli]